jgi:hypothetical protein
MEPKQTYASIAATPLANVINKQNQLQIRETPKTLANSPDKPKPKEIEIKINRLQTHIPDSARQPRSKYVTKETWNFIESCIDDTSCTLCGYKGSAKRKAKIHVRQHFTKVFCPCGYGSVSRDSVGCHQRNKNRSTRHGGPKKICIEVEEKMFSMLKNDMNWGPEVAFGDIIPTLDGHGERRKTPLSRNTMTPGISFNKKPPMKRIAKEKQKICPPSPQLPATLDRPAYLPKPPRTNLPRMNFKIPKKSNILNRLGNKQTPLPKSPSNDDWKQMTIRRTMLSPIPSTPVKRKILSESTRPNIRTKRHTSPVLSNNAEWKHMLINRPMLSPIPSTPKKKLLTESIRTKDIPDILADFNEDICDLYPDEEITTSTQNIENIPLCTPGKVTCTTNVQPIDTITSIDKFNEEKRQCTTWYGELLLSDANDWQNKIQRLEKKLTIARRAAQNARREADNCFNKYYY